MVFAAKSPRPCIGLLAIRVFGERYEAGMGTLPRRHPIPSQGGASAAPVKGWLGSPSAAPHTAVPDTPSVESGGSERRSSPDTPPPLVSPVRSACRAAGGHGEVSRLVRG